MNIRAYIEHLRNRVISCPATREQLALATNGVVSASWLSKFVAGKMRNPRADSLMALDAALEHFDCSPAISDDA